jgi:hypothetical protein
VRLRSAPSQPWSAPEHAGLELRPSPCLAHSPSRPLPPVWPPPQHPPHLDPPLHFLPSFLRDAYRDVAHPCSLLTPHALPSAPRCSLCQPWAHSCAPAAAPPCPHFLHLDPEHPLSIFPLMRNGCSLALHTCDTPLRSETPVWSVQRSASGCAASPADSMGVHSVGLHWGVWRAKVAGKGKKRDNGKLHACVALNR